MIVTFEQAKALKELGYEKRVIVSYNCKTRNLQNHVDVNANSLDDTYYSAPTVAEALQFIRDKYKVYCTVDVDYFDGFYYTGKYYNMDKIEFKHLNSFDEYPEAESALLTEVIKYLKEKLKL